MHLIDESVKIRETFSFAHPSEKIFAINKYCGSHYSSSLWDLKSTGLDSYCAAWRNSLKLSWNVDRGCHRYFLHNLLAPDVPPIRSTLLSKFHGFFLGLLHSPSKEVSLLARLAAKDIKTVFGSNVKLFQEVSGLDPWEAGKWEMKRALQYVEWREVPEEDQWRMIYLPKLLWTRQMAFYDGDDTQYEYMTSLIHSLTKN